MLLITSRGPSPSVNASLNASITARGFLRSKTLRKSNENRNVNTSGKSSGRGFPTDAAGMSTGNGKTRTGFVVTTETASATYWLATQISSTQSNAACIDSGKLGASQNQTPTVYRSSKYSPPACWAKIGSWSALTHT